MLPSTAEGAEALDRDAVSGDGGLERFTDASVVLRSGSPYEEAIFIGNELYSHRRPNYVIKPRTVADIAAALDLAKANDLPFSVKGGGHSYAGYCLNEGGVVLDMSDMCTVEVDPVGMTVRVEGGARWLSVYEALAQVNPDFIVMGGICPSVGVAGAVLGGGINLFSRAHGLAIDTLQAVTLMTPNGELLHLSGSPELAEDLQDLWWAIRGGGGGNFGVVVSLTLRIFDVGPLAIGVLSWDELAAFEKALAVVNAGLDRRTSVDAVWVKSGPGAATMGSMTVGHLGSVQTCRAALAPIFSSSPAPSQDSLSHQVFVDWEESDRAWDPFEPGTYFYHVAYIFGPGRITHEVVSTISDLMARAPSRSTFHWNHTAGAVSEVDPEATAYFWRGGEYVATAKIYWFDTSHTAACMAWARSVKDRLGPYALEGKASYVNYIENPFDGWQEAYYGRNYARLRKVKSRVDPTNVLRFPMGIEPMPMPRP